MINVILDTKFIGFIKILGLVFLIPCLYSCKVTLKGSKPFYIPVRDINKDSMSTDVKAQMVQSWNTYKKFAWGHDEVRPLSLMPKDYYVESLLYTPLSAYSTLKMMGLNEEADECKELILSRLNFDKDIVVNHAEVVHVVLGGLLSAYEIDHDDRWLDLAVNLGERLKPVFKSPWGLSYRNINLKTGEVSGNNCTPDELSGLLLEYGMLTKYSGDSTYYKNELGSVKALYNRKSKIGLLGSAIDIRSGQWTNPESNIMEGNEIWIDNLYKAAVLFNSAELYAFFTHYVTAIIKYLKEYTDNGTWYENGNMNYGTQVHPEFSMQSCNFPALLTMFNNQPEAISAFESVIRYWAEYGIAPEQMNYKTKQIISASYLLRPQALYSAAVMNKYVPKPRYLMAGDYFYSSIVKFCQNGTNGFAVLRDVRTLEKMDQLDYYFYGATLKYAYMLYNPEAADYLDTHVFTSAGMMFRKSK